LLDRFSKRISPIKFFLVQSFVSLLVISTAFAVPPNSLIHKNDLGVEYVEKFRFPVNPLTYDGIIEKAPSVSGVLTIYEQKNANEKVELLQVNYKISSSYLPSDDWNSLRLLQEKNYIAISSDVLSSGNDPVIVALKYLNENYSYLTFLAKTE
jgi:hypothetical protein